MITQQDVDKAKQANLIMGEANRLISSAVRYMIAAAILAVGACVCVWSITFFKNNALWMPTLSLMAGSAVLYFISNRYFRQSLRKRDEAMELFPHDKIAEIFGPEEYDGQNLRDTK